MTLDSELMEDVARWHALQDLLDNLDGENERINAAVPERFKHLESFDPRGWNPEGYTTAHSRQIVQELIEFEPIYVSCGLAAVNDRRDALHDEQDPITNRVKNACPVSTRGKAALVGVMFRAINSDLLRNPSDDWDVGVAGKARDTLALIEASN